MKPTPDSLPWANGIYSIKQHGVSIANCDSEPVHTPGCIQEHGVLFVLHPADFTILQVSENIADHFGGVPEAWLGKTISKLTGDDLFQRLAHWIGERVLEQNPTYAFTLAASSTHGEYDLILHTIDGYVILECESSVLTPEASESMYGRVKNVVSQLQNSNTLDGFFDIIVNQTRALTGIDRVMIYRFHEDFHGEVVAESKREDLSPWLGLHYPAEDIPYPAREIFKKIWVRPLADAGGRPMELVPLANPENGRPLTMTYCALRGASVMYTEYLRNMGVEASLTLSLMVDGKLWGLIACQHQTPIRFSHETRSACEFLAQVASLQLRAVEQRESLVYRLKLEESHNRIVTNAAQDAGLGPLTTASPNILDQMEAGGVAIFHGDRWWKVGRAPADMQLDALKDWLEKQPEFDTPSRPVFVTDSLSKKFPPAADYAKVASGLLAVSLSRQRHTFILWFRPETIQTVNWGGNPHDKPTVVGPHGPRLTSRKSFEIFAESVKNCSLPWKKVEIDAALRLRLLIMELVVSRAEQITEMNVDLARANEELDAFAYVASHDLKEPLRGISKYAHQLMTDAQQEDSERLQKLESIQRLATRMDTLLDSLLHFSRVGRTVIIPVAVNLRDVIEEALEITSIRREEKETRITIAAELPPIQGDRMRVREIFVNLISNALKYNDKEMREIEIGSRVHPEHGLVLYVRDNGIGIESKHREAVFQIFKRLHDRGAYGGGSGAGLSIVQRLVSQHGGKVWIESTPGVDCVFYFTLQPSFPAIS